jgi:hypothetical protein
MNRFVAALVLTGIVLGLEGCSSASSSLNEPKKIEGKRIPPGKGPKELNPPEGQK